MSPIELYGLVLAGSVLGVAAILAGWHWADRRFPAPTLSDEDVAHYSRQDIRRKVVAGIMAVLGVLILAGSRTSHKVHGRPNPLFVEIWLGVFVLVVVLLVLAGADWLATRRYARRQRSAIVREGMELLREELRLRAAPPTNGRAHDGPDRDTDD